MKKCAARINSTYPNETWTKHRLLAYLEFASHFSNSNCIGKNLILWLGAVLSLLGLKKNYLSTLWSGLRNYFTATFFTSHTAYKKIIFTVCSLVECARFTCRQIHVKLPVDKILNKWRKQESRS